MQDQLEFLDRKKIPAMKIDSSQTKEEFLKAIDLAKQNKIKILMISPERFKNEIFRENLKQIKIDLMVIDEAHSISEWGHNFRPDYLKLPHYRKEFNIKNVLLLTATATEKVIKDMKKQFEIKDENIVITGFYRKNLDLAVEVIESKLKDEYLLKELKDIKKESTIIYTTQQKTADRVAKMLIDKGYNSRSYHAGKNSEEREQIQREFMSAQIDIIVATIAFGMGIDKSDIRNIIHYNLPKSLENYAQEIGRAGRDGKNSKCKVLASEEDLSVLKNFIYGDFIEKISLKKLLKKIEESETEDFEVSEYHLSRELNIKNLPLKTLFVYLEMFQILEPVSYSFKKIQFKLKNTDEEIKEVLIKKVSEDIIDCFFNSFEKKKIWSYLSVEKFLESNSKIKKGDLIEIIQILELEELIEYELKDSYELFKIKKRPSQVKNILENLYNLIVENIKNEIKKLTSMVDFFESQECLSFRLSNYFGEKNSEKRCGHCSVCRGSIVKILKKDRDISEELKKFDIESLSFLKEILGEFYSLVALTKYLSGIRMPALEKKYYDINFGRFEEIEFDKIYRSLKEKRTFLL